MKWFENLKTTKKLMGEFGRIALVVAMIRIRGNEKFR